MLIIQEFSSVNQIFYFQYHYDNETMTCLAFRFTGCGGNLNNFASSTKCFITCVPQDYNKCPANRPPVKRADGSFHCNDKVKCPEGSSCRRGLWSGKCCDNKDIEKIRANYHPDCGGRKFIKEESGGIPVGFSNSTAHSNGKAAK
ncbi:unnamed protein product [Nippostrongylus brasiliensis]|uniref:BPTI/Kunitz inhibitor domain-containing protein n=1 Tax=Nippostrongylus brasiliensis TaxID=27835 RepID=A0A0N4YQ24_NIPBR|nr:unnamed protein product [Nippostrongylus brasiliensis]